MHRVIVLTLVAALAGGAMLPAAAQTGDSARAAVTKQVRAVRLTQGTIHVDGRLDTQTNAITPTAGTLFITDLVFSNPTGASGELTLQRTSSTGATALLVLRLENFRDLDFHFITPIAVRAGETLALVPKCLPPVGPGPGGDCAPAVFYSGYLTSP